MLFNAVCYLKNLKSTEVNYICRMHSLEISRLTKFQAKIISCTYLFLEHLKESYPGVFRVLKTLG